MFSLRLAMLFAFLGGQALWVTFWAHHEYLPPAPDFNRFTRQLGAWKMQGDIPIDTDTLATLQSDAVLSRTYVESQTASSAQLLVAWFRTQRGGQKQPHSPKVCLPASGWLPLRSDVLRIGTLDVNRYLVANRSNRGVVLYWYRTPFRNETSEWTAKLWGMIDSVRYSRSDTALVRIFVPVLSNDEAASAAAVRFVKSADADLEVVIPK